MIMLDHVSAEEVGIQIEHRHPRPIPKRKVIEWTVPGRSGKLYRWLDAWDNVRLKYDIAVSWRRGELSAMIDKAVNWLTRDGLRRLEDDADPGVFYLVTYVGGTELKPVLHIGKRATIEFDAMPQRWLKEGERSISFAAAGSLRNPTGNPSKPLITLRGSGAGTVTLGGKTLSVSECSGLTLDCETCQRSDSSVTVTGDWPTLAEGDTAVSFTGGIQSVEIIPRWYAI